jgi:hypothetical protein
MPIGIHRDCQRRLAELIAAQLPQAQVVAHRWFDPGAMDLSIARRALSDRDQIRAALERYVGEDPIADFVLHRLWCRLIDTQELQPDAQRLPLTALPEFADTNALATGLVNDLNSLPWKYAIVTVAPGSAAWHVDQPYRLSDDVILWPVNDEFRQTFPLESGNRLRDQELSPTALLMAASQLEWKEGATYLQINVDGYLGWQTQPKLDAELLLRALAGLGIALHLIEPGTSALRRRLTAETPYFLGFRQSDDGQRWRIEQRQNFGTAVANGLLALDIHHSLARIADEAQRMQKAVAGLSLVGRLLAQRENAKNLFLAAQWLFDSHCGHDELLRFVQTTIVVEVLLGDKAATDIVGLSVLLANRCAYLIAETRAEREHLITQFRAIYDVRSKIVHAGKTHLTTADRSLFAELQYICARIMLDEIRLLCK